MRWQRAGNSRPIHSLQEAHVHCEWAKPRWVKPQNDSPLSCTNCPKLQCLTIAVKVNVCHQAHIAGILWVKLCATKLLRIKTRSQTWSCCAGAVLQRTRAEAHPFSRNTATSARADRTEGWPQSPASTAQQPWARVNVTYAIFYLAFHMYLSAQMFASERNLFKYLLQNFQFI